MSNSVLEEIQQVATARGWTVAIGEPVARCGRAAWRPIAELLTGNTAKLVLFYYKERLYVATTKCVARKLRIHFNSLRAFSADAFVVDRLLARHYPYGWKVLEEYSPKSHLCVLPAEKVLELMQTP